MNDRDQGGSAAHAAGSDREVARAWQVLAAALTVQLRQMSDAEDHLLVELPEFDDGEGRPYSHFVGKAGGRLRAEVSGNVHLAATHVLSDDECDALRAQGWHGNDETDSNWWLERPLAEAAALAEAVVEVLSDVYDVAHPQLMTYRAWGPHADTADQLGLSATVDVPAELPEPEDDEPLVLTPDGPEDLVMMVKAVLHATRGEAPEVDGDGDIVLTHMGQPVFIRARHDVPALEIFARVAHGVYSRRAAAIEVGVLNKNHVFVKWVLSGRNVFQGVTVPTSPFAVAHFEGLLGAFLHTMTETRDDLVTRLGAKAG